MRLPLITPVVDVSEDVRRAIGALRDIGVKTVFRYYSYYQQQLPTKRLQKPECDALIEAGFSVAVVWQYFSQQIGRFSITEASHIADACLEQAGKVSQPAGSAIYFGVDGDLGLTIAQGRILVSFFEYMTDRLRKADLKVGVYGSGDVCQMLRRKKVAEFFWLPKSPGWAGTRDYYASGHWTLFQNIHEHPLAKTGVKADFNVVNPNVTNLGEWSKHGVGKTHSKLESQNIFDTYRFPKSNPLVFRLEPSINATEIYRLKDSRTKSVKIVEKKQDWVRIYFGDEDAISGKFTTATGWCRDSDLSPDYRAMTY